MSLVRFRRVPWGVMLLLMCAAGRADATAPDVMMVLDLPPVAADAATQEQAVRNLADVLPADARLGVVSSDKAGGRLRAALMAPAQAASAAAASDQVPMVDKDPAAAVERALYELRITGRSDVPHAVVFVGDAVSADVERRNWLRDSLTADAARLSTRIFVVAWGEAADIELAQSMARSTSGEYFRAASLSELKSLMPRLAEMLAREPGAVPTAVPAEVPEKPAPVPAAPESDVPAVVAPATVSGPDLLADRPAGWVLAVLVGIGALLGGLVAWWVASRRAPQAGRGAVRATPSAYLVDVHGVTPLSRYVLGARPVMIGRVPGKDTRLFDYITVPINTVSRRHAVIEYRDGAYWVVDQGSVNGTRVNDKRIKGKRPLQHGDRIGLHRCELQFELSDASVDLDQTVIADQTHVGARTVVAKASPPEVAVASGAKANAARTQPPPDPTVVLTLSDVTGPVPADAIPLGTAVDVPSDDAAPPRRSTLDSFINTTLIQSPPTSATLPTKPELPPGARAVDPMPTSATAGELSIDDFLDNSDPFALVDDAPSAAAPSSSAPGAAAPLQATQKLDSATDSADIDEFRLGDTINLFEAGGPIEETTPLEMFLREHAGELPAAEADPLHGAREQSRKK